MEAALVSPGILHNSIFKASAVSLSSSFSENSLLRKNSFGGSTKKIVQRKTFGQTFPKVKVSASLFPGYDSSVAYDSFGLSTGSEGVVIPRAARRKAPPIMPAVMTPGGPSDLVSAFFRNRIIFIGSPINGQVAQRVISQLMTLATIDEEEDIKIYINCPGGSTYSVLAVYDCMAWVKPDISTVAFGLAASQGSLILAGGTKGKRFAMPNARIMIHQPQGGCGGTALDVRRQVNEVVSSRDKLDKMFSAFTGQPIEVIQKYTDRDRFFSAAEAVEFGLIDGVIETEY